MGNDPYLPPDPEEKCIFIDGKPPIPVPKWLPSYLNWAFTRKEAMATLVMRPSALRGIRHGARVER